MRLIRFSKNWNNKLSCDCFTTIRLRNDLINVINDIVRVECSDKEFPAVFDARIASIRHFTLEQLTSAMTYIDMALPLNKGKSVLINMYKNKCNLSTQEFSFIVLHKQIKS